MNNEVLNRPIVRQALVKMSFRQVIDCNSKTEFEKQVWNDSFSEYLIQVQSFDKEGTLSAWDLLAQKIPKAKINVTYKVSFAIGLYVRQLNNIIPNMNDTIGKSIPFSKWSFEILQSSINDKQQHRVAINYETEELELKAIVGKFVVVSTPGSLTNETLTIKIQKDISISAFKYVGNEEFN